MIGLNTSRPKLSPPNIQSVIPYCLYLRNVQQLDDLILEFGHIYMIFISFYYAKLALSPEQYVI